MTGLDMRGFVVGQQIRIIGSAVDTALPFNSPRYQSDVMGTCARHLSLTRSMILECRLQPGQAHQATFSKAMDEDTLKYHKLHTDRTFRPGRPVRDL